MDDKLLFDKTYGTADDYGTREIQKELLKLLVLFHDTCRVHNIIYSLNSGTLLGAIRHNGFIPWDDDADVMMTRMEFERFMKLDHHDYGYRIDQHRWVNRIMSLDSTSTASIDIFVLDNVPDNAFLRHAKLFMIKALQGTMKGKVNIREYKFPYNMFVLVTYVIGTLFSEKRKYNIYQIISKIGNKKTSQYLGIYNNLFNSLARLYNPIMMKNIIEHQFEDTLLDITSLYDEYLTSVYGDYMTPPNMKDRKAGNFKIICNDNSIEIKDSKHL